jgi:hypothetical protein
MQAPQQFAPFAREVTIPASRAHLIGDVDIPAGASGLVIFAHGSGSGRKSARNRFVAEKRSATSRAWPTRSSAFRRRNLAAARFNEDFDQTSDEEVVELLHESRAELTLHDATR